MLLCQIAITILLFVSQILATAVPNFTPVVLKNILVCDEQRIVQHYNIPKSKPCSKIKPAKISTCNAKLYEPTLSHIPINGYACSLKTENYQARMYFWGEKILQTSTPIISGTTVEQCATMIATKKLPGIGPLHQRNTITYQTHNAIIPTYKWLQTINDQTINAYMEEITFFYDFATDNILTDLTKTGTCKYDNGFCKTETVTLVWQKQNNKFCKYLKNSSHYQGETKLHYDNTDTLISVEIPEITVAFNEFKPTNSKILQCFTETNMEVRQTYNDFVLVSNDCFSQRQTLPSLPAKIFSAINNTKSTINDPENLIIPLLDFLSTTITDHIEQLEKQINLLQCQNNQETQLQMKLLARMFPSEVLSKLVNRKTAATSQGNVLSELSCTKASAHLTPSLRYEHNRYATRPIALLHTPNKSIIIQQQPDGYWSDSIKAFSQVPIQGLMTFKVKNRIITYNNMTLMAEPLEVNRLFYTTMNISVAIPKYDFTRSTMILQPPIQNEALSSMQAALTELQFQSHIANDPNNGLFFKDGIYASQAVHNSILTPLSKVTNPALIILVTLIHILNSLWSIFFTIALCYLIYKYCIAITPPSQQPNTIYQLPENLPTYQTSNIDDF